MLHLMSRRARASRSKYISTSFGFPVTLEFRGCFAQLVTIFSTQIHEVSHGHSFYGFGANTAVKFRAYTKLTRSCEKSRGQGMLLSRF